jgi:mRNA-degrading endonuclease RelE of RelBE toxin-antitoxin system
MDAETRSLVSHLSPARKRSIRESLRAIAADPSVGKPLREDLAGLSSYRVGSLRIVYSIEAPPKVVHVVAIGPRRTVYEEIERELLRRR